MDDPSRTPVRAATRTMNQRRDVGGRGSGRTVDASASGCAGWQWSSDETTSHLGRMDRHGDFSLGRVGAHDVHLPQEMPKLRVDGRIVEYLELRLLRGRQEKGTTPAGAGPFSISKTH